MKFLLFVIIPSYNYKFDPIYIVDGKHIHYIGLGEYVQR